MDKTHVKVVYDVEKDDIYIEETNASQEGLEEIFETYIRSQTGKSPDNREPHEIPKYTVFIELDLAEDDIRATSDTGNQGLTVGIVMEAARLLAHGSLETKA